MKKYIFIVILIIITISLQVARAIYSNTFTTTGITLDQILTQVDNLKTQNIILSDKLDKKTAYIQIQKEAEKMGLTYDPNSTIAISLNTPLALR